MEPQKSARGSIIHHHPVIRNHPISGDKCILSNKPSKPAGEISPIHIRRNIIHTDCYFHSSLSPWQLAALILLNQSDPSTVRTIGFRQSYQQLPRRIPEKSSISIKGCILTPYPIFPAETESFKRPAHPSHQMVNIPSSHEINLPVRRCTFIIPPAKSFDSRLIEYSPIPISLQSLRISLLDTRIFLILQSPYRIMH